jgi:hypothetical protein
MNCRHFMAVAFWAVLAIALQAPIPIAQGAGTDDWIATWTASPQPIWDADFLAPIEVPRNLWNQTVRQMATVSIGGKQVRVVLSNEYGDRPLEIGAAHVALADKGSAIAAVSGKPLTFGGRTSMPCWTSTRSCATRADRPTSRPSTTPAIIFTPTTPATRPWRSRST